MSWYVMLMLFSPLYLMLGLVLRSEQARLVLALHHQVLVLQPQLGKRELTEALLIVRPKTLVGWRRAIVRRDWRLLSRRKPGRPAEITPETEQWVLAEYALYYNQRRPRQLLQHLPPEAPDADACEGTVVARPVLRGLIDDYCRLAA